MSEIQSPISKVMPTRLLDPSERKPLSVVKHHSKKFRIFYVSFKLLTLFAGNVVLKLGGKKTASIREERTIKYIQQLGTIWIRIFQTLTMRSPILSSAAGLRLLDIRDIGSFSKFDQIKNIVEKELECSLEKVFDHFDEKPFYATAVSQLHRARLKKEQRWATVKIQQPLAKEIFDLDLRLFRIFIWIRTYFSQKDGMRWEELYHELKDIKTRELNYHYEVTALEILGKNLKGQQVHVSKVYRSYCTQRLLVTEYIQGAFLSDIIKMKNENPKRLDKWLMANNINLSTVAKNLFNSTFRQVFEDNFFHGDMNTHAIILLRNSNIAMVECRSAGSLEIESLKKQKLFLRSLAEKEYVIAAEIYFLLASQLPRVDLNTAKEHLVRIWRIWETRTHIEGLPYNQKSHAFMTAQVNKVVYDFQFSPLWSFAKLTCAWVHLDIALEGLAPDLNYIKQLKTYYHQAQVREDVNKLVHLPSRLASTMAYIHQVPKRTDEYALFKENLLRRQAQAVHGSASKFDAVIASVIGMTSFLLLLVSIFFFLVFCQHFLDVRLELLIGSQLSRFALLVPDMHIGVWVSLFAILGFLYQLFYKQKKQFQRSEFGRSNHSATLDT